MITLIYGQDTESSYKRLQDLISKFPNHTKIHLDQNSTEEAIYTALFGQNLTGEEEIIILQDIFKSSKNILKFLNQLTADKEVILWEKQDLDKRAQSKLPPNIKVEYFKKTSPIFNFLDSIVPKSKQAATLAQLQQDHVLWNLQNRIFMLILAKIGLEAEEAGIIAVRQLQDWQWQKIKDQSSKFETKRLLSFFEGALKVDYMIKTGRTALDENTLTSVLIMKYLH